MIDKNKQIIILVICILFLHLPFIFKPVHIDGWVFIKGAERYCDYLSEPLEGSIGFWGEEVSYTLLTHPPLVFLYIALIKLLFEGIYSVTVLHVFYLIFCLTIGLSCYRMFKVFCKDHFFASLLFVSMPAIVIAGNNIMADSIFLFFFLSTILCFIYGVNSDKSRYLILSSIAFGLAVFTAYQALFLYVLLFIYTIIYRKRFLDYIFVCFIPISIIVVWLSYVWFHSGNIHIFDALSWAGYNDIFSMNRILDNVIGSICTIGAVSVFPLIIIYLMYKEEKSKSWYLIVVVLSLILLLGRISEYPFVSKGFFILFFISGLWLVYKCFYTLIKTLFNVYTYRNMENRSKDQIFMFFWFLSYLACIIILFPQTNARYFLPLLFPVIFFIVKFINQIPKVNMKNGLKKITIILTLSTSVLVAIGDYKNAESNIEVIEPVLKRYKSRHIWFIAELGLRYYMEKAGFKYLLSTENNLQDGDIII